LVPISNEDQRRYGINFLTVRTNRILGVDGVSSAYKKRLRSKGVKATWMDFQNLTGGFGVAHCTTQVLRRAN
jgi:arginine deiminase